jgi:hypothetical protein
LSYKIKTLVELPVAQFDFLVENVSVYVESRELSQRLYRDDIEKAVYAKFDPEDEDLFKDLLKSSSAFLIGDTLGADES